MDIAAVVMPVRVGGPKTLVFTNDPTNHLIPDKEAKWVHATREAW